MENQLQIVAQLIKKISGQDRLPAAAVFRRVPDSPPPHCAICLNDICDGERYRKLPECVHGFHADCIDAWFQTHSTCPLCRTQVPQIISINENQEKWNVILNNIILLVKDLIEKMCNPLNDELSSMICDRQR